MSQTSAKLTPKDQARLARAACYDSLDVFAAGAFSIINPGIQYKWNWHIDCICEYLEAAYRGEIRRLIINMPPRALKSYLCSIVYPAWILGREPHEQFIVASHTMRPLATKLSNDTRRLMDSEWYKSLFPETIIEKSTEEMFVTTKNGHRMATSIGRSPTGLGFNFGIIDDPNRPDEALSDTIRMHTNDWIDQTFMSRMNDRMTGRVIQVMQRVHEDDGTGHLFKKGYTQIKLPAEAVSKSYSYEVNGKTFKLNQGELLHPERLPQSALDELRIDLGEYGYAGQYLQEPVPIGGGLFKDQWVKYYNIEKFNLSNCNVFILCDPAGVGDVPGVSRKRKKSDWTAFMVVALSTDNNYYLLDIVRDKLNPTERIDKLFELHREWSAQTNKPPKVGYESYGLQTDLHYINQKQVDESYRFTLIPLGGQMSKPDRIARLIPDMENGRWYFPNKILYTDSRNLTFDLVNEMIRGEMATFPMSKHDDCIDALSRIYDEDVGAKFPKLIKKSQLLGPEVSQSDGAHWINF